MEFIDGAVRRGPLSDLWHVPFERVMPVRSFPSFKGQSNFPGWWYSSTMDAHVGYESWLERDHVMALDYDWQIVGFSSQPFWLHWTDGEGSRRHAPDFFARAADGSAVVIDVRADDRIEQRDAEAFAATEQACGLVGWVFRRVGTLPPVVGRNLRWLSRYRHRRFGGGAATVDRLIGVFDEPRALFAGAAAAGDTLATLPVLFHLMWQQILTVDLDGSPLNPSTVVRRGPGRLP